MEEQNWKRIIRNRNLEKVFIELFLESNNIKGLAKKIKKSKNTIKKYMRDLENMGYLNDLGRVVKNNGKYAAVNIKETNLNAFFEYFEEVANLSLTKDEKKIINYLFEEKLFRTRALNYRGGDIFQKMSQFLLDFCMQGLKEEKETILRYKQKNILRNIQNSYPRLSKKNKKDVIRNIKIDKLKRNLPYTFVIKILQLTSPPTLGEIILKPIEQNCYQISLRTKEEKALIKKMGGLPVSRGEINKILEGIKAYKKSERGWELKVSDPNTPKRTKLSKAKE